MQTIKQKLVLKNRIKKIHIFDLDGTVIDSSHRQMYNPLTGALDLKNWVINSTPEKVANDSLLPFADFWRYLLANTNDFIMVCTARVMRQPDFDFLTNNGLRARKIYSRPYGCQEKDHLLKLMQLRGFFNLSPFKMAEKFLYDDNAKVREALQGVSGIIALHPDEVKISWRIETTI